MRFKNPTLDTVWLGLIGAAFIVGFPVWVVIWYERNPVLGILQAVLIPYLLWRKSRS